MNSTKFVPLWRRASVVASLIGLMTPLVSPIAAAAQQSPANAKTPIQHVIVIIGENRTFDHIFATYKPVPGQKVDNLLSKRIVNEDGTPGPNYLLATQWSAVDKKPEKFSISPQGKSLYGTLPPPLTGGPTTPFFSSTKDAGPWRMAFPVTITGS